MRTCPNCHGRRQPCDVCNGRRIVEGDPATADEAARVAMTEEVERDGLGAVYDRLSGEDREAG
jgi:hypothetical protein